MKKQNSGGGCGAIIYLFLMIAFFTAIGSILSAIFTIALAIIGIYVAVKIVCFISKFVINFISKRRSDKEAFEETIQEEVFQEEKQLETYIPNEECEEEIIAENEGEKEEELEEAKTITEENTSADDKPIDDKPKKQRVSEKPDFSLYGFMIDCNYYVNSVEQMEEYNKWLNKGKEDSVDSES